MGLGWCHWEGLVLALQWMSPQPRRGASCRMGFLPQEDQNLPIVVVGWGGGQAAGWGLHSPGPQ